MTARGARRPLIAGLRARILAIIVVVTCLTAGVTGIAVTVVVRDWVYQDAQDAVLTTFRHDMETFERTPTRSRAWPDGDAPPGAPAGGDQPPRFTALASEYLVEVDGETVQWGSGIRPQDIPRSMRSELVAVPSLYRFQRMSDGRMLVAHSVNRPANFDASSVVVYGVQPLEDVGSRLNRLTILLIVAVVGSALLGILVALVVARTVIRPLSRIQAVAARVTEGDVEARLPATEVTELRDLTETFNSMLDRQSESIDVLRRQDARSRRFVGDVSHELRSPLAALVPAAEVLREEAASLGPESDLRRASELVASEVDTLAELVDDLLEMTRLDAGAAEVRRAPFELVGAIREALSARGWRSVALDGVPSLSLESDRRRVVAVVTNLVGNAVRHGAPPVTVTVTAAPDGTVVEVRDHGPGVPPGDEERVFGRFAKAQEARSRGTGGGAGLGLAIARDNARLLGGDVDYRRDGASTVFRLWLGR
ncbi:MULTISPECIES: sensor histidine kinase [Tsukamurella]|uniref:histidine kinase n=2 Tax=Tsukamurella TaxID=2060 RepID=A0A5C5RY22_9ACTN|nr:MULTISPECIES: HAMP domain-containing sensor histidine kinase [Tsukamurella]NMD57080.1 HAMP domain-containing histidine kinase [Tsukamurella columbiensis]TWS27694.1 HAMP domain-containing histidine kinase [Tsukamurella conjunctivitidis]